MSEVIVPVLAMVVFALIYGVVFIMDEEGTGDSITASENQTKPDTGLVVQMAYEPFNNSLIKGEV